MLRRSRTRRKALAYRKKKRANFAPNPIPKFAALAGKVAYDSGNFSWSYSLLQEAARQRANDPSIPARSGLGGL